MRAPLLALLLALPTFADEEPPQPAPLPTEAQIREAAAQLVDRQEATRNAGMSALAAFGKHAQAVLRELAASDDPEVRWRARLVLGRPKLVALGVSQDAIGCAFVVVYLEAEKGEADPQAMQVQVGADPIWVERKPVTDGRAISRASPKSVDPGYGIALTFDATGAKALDAAAARGKGRRLVLAIDGRGAHVWTIERETIGGELTALSGLPIQAAQKFAKGIELGRKID